MKSSLEQIKAVKIFTLALCSLLLTACASKRVDVSQEGWKVRTYEGYTKEQVVSAAREVIRLADSQETKFENTLDGFNAERTQLAYYVVQSSQDYYKYQFIAREAEGKVHSRVDIEEVLMRANVLTLGMPVFDVGKPQSSYIYDLFYSRIDYLLGKSKSWYSCSDAVSKVSAKFGKANDATKLGMGALCGRFTDDKIPSQVTSHETLFN